MKTQRQAEVVAAVAAQPMSPHALPHGLSGERLTSRFRCASMAGMKTRLNTDGAVAGVGQPAPSAALLNGAAGEKSASGVRCARVAGMNSRAGTQITRGGGLADLIWRRIRFVRAGGHCRGFDRAAKRLGLVDLFAGGEISTAVVALAVPSASALVSPFVSLLSAERFSHSASRCQRPPLRDHSCRVAADRRSGFKVIALAGTNLVDCRKVLAIDESICSISITTSNERKESS